MHCLCRKHLYIFKEKSYTAACRVHFIIYIQYILYTYIYSFRKSMPDLSIFLGQRIQVVVSELLDTVHSSTEFC